MMRAKWDDSDQRLNLDVDMPKGTARKIYVRWPIHKDGRPEQVTVEGDDSYRIDDHGIWFSGTSFKLMARW